MQLSLFNKQKTNFSFFLCTFAFVISLKFGFNMYKKHKHKKKGKKNKFPTILGLSVSEFEMVTENISLIKEMQKATVSL